MRDVRPGDLVLHLTDDRVFTEVFRTFSYSRINQPYDELHRFCRLFIEHGSLSDRSGETPLPGFLVNMNVLFEEFVTEVLRRSLSDRSVHAQREVALSVDHSFVGRPDLTIETAGERPMIGDCKYKRLLEGDLIHEDLYQLIAYCSASSTTEGFLVYPRLESVADATLLIPYVGIRVTILTVELRQPGDGL